MLLLAGELHPDGTADRARQQQRIGGHVVGTIAAVAAGGFQPDQIDLFLWTLQKQREVGAQDVGILRAGPDLYVAFLIICDSAGRADRSVHLIRPDIRPRHRLGGGGDRRIDVALVDQGARH